jgi:selenophosphate synthetase-related protein
VSQSFSESLQKMCNKMQKQVANFGCGGISGSDNTAPSTQHPAIAIAITPIAHCPLLIAANCM